MLIKQLTGLWQSEIFRREIMYRTMYLPMMVVMVVVMLMLLLMLMEMMVVVLVYHLRILFKFLMPRQ
jgi:hypothetical protein